MRGGVAEIKRHCALRGAQTRGSHCALGAAYPFRGDVVRVLGTSARVRFADGETHDIAFNQPLRIIGSYEP